MMTSSAWIRSSRLKPVVPNPQANGKCENHFDTYGWRCLLYVGGTRYSKLLYLRSSLRLSFKRV